MQVDVSKAEQAFNTSKKKILAKYKPKIDREREAIERAEDDIDRLSSLGE